ncbi:MAG: heavy metal translocating P-type ATPase [Bifidobacterium subtile]|jgi:Cd2+/Zn2+-exporting ATPase|nr:heavy metal translocating P-type ATPase [Bifidobacterium subtile]MCI1258562.1 heavy metal translocating P-type ATPase [Bifidobacterium subtile]
MLALQRFFTQHKRTIVIAMSVAIAVALIAHYAFTPLIPTLSAAWKITSSTLYIAVGVVGLVPLIIKAITSLKFKVVSIELLVSVAVVGALIIGEFSEAGIVTWLFLLGEVIEDATLAKTRSAIKDLTQMAPQTAQRIDSPTDRNPEEVDVDEIDVGDYLLVTTGSQVPVDGQIVFGDAHLDEASVTGEPLPKHKSASADAQEPGDEVFAGTTLTDGTIVVQATKVGEDTVFGKIIELVEEAEDSKTSAQRFIDRFAKYYTPIVLLIALVVGIVTRDVRLAITILVLGCPGALVIGVPVSNVAGIGLGARHGVLAKGAQMLQTLSEVDTVVFDKTGTLTTGHPSVVHAQDFAGAESAGVGSADVRTSGSSPVSTTEVWHLVASAEHESTHPLAQAVVDYAKTERNVSDYTAVTATHVVAGKGLVATVAGHEVAIGNLALMEAQGIPLDATGTPAAADEATDGTSAATSATSATHLAAAWGSQGLSVVYAAVDGTLRLTAAIGDALRDSAAGALRELKDRGIKHLVMLSGDTQETVDAIAAQLGLDEALGAMLPQDKADFIAKLQGSGRKVAFVGDGINDSPALVASDLGIAMGNGTATAVEISDVVLLNSDISKLPVAYGIARATVANTRENIGIAMATVLFLFIGLFAGFIYMASGMFVHEASILVVVVNALRLLHKKINTKFEAKLDSKLDARQV